MSAKWSKYGLISSKSKFASVLGLISDCDSPAADSDDPEQSSDRMRDCGHRRPRHGRGQGLHEGERKEERRTEIRPTTTNFQRRKVLRGKFLI